MRRILKSGKWIADDAAEGRQVRRAFERNEVRRKARFQVEEEEIEKLRRQIQQGSLDSDSSTSPASAPSESATAQASSAPPPAPATRAKAPIVTQVRYEGLLVDTSNSASSTGASGTATKRGGGSTRRSPLAHGDGTWCMVDAGWCVVHVMTADARARYAIEEIWEKAIQRNSQQQRDSDDADD